MHKNQTTSPVILGAIVVLGFLLGYVYYANYIQGTITPSPLPHIKADDTLNKFKNLNISFTIFDDAQFRVLKIFGESPIDTGNPGRTNIFTPFQ